MKEDNLRTKATVGTLWNALDNILNQAVQLVIYIVLARLLMPQDFGLVGMLVVFTAIGQTLVTSGLGTALMQKANRTEEDFSTVFVFNFVVSASIYVVIWFAAPFVAKFYKLNQLTVLTRVLCLNIPIYALMLVPSVKLALNLDFKRIAWINIISIVVSGLSAILFAYGGLGVWSLVLQNVMRSLICTYLFFHFVYWKPSFHFSTKSFKKLFGFGSRILGAGLLTTLADNIYRVVIGKSFSSLMLGYYSQSFQVVEMVSGTVTSVLNRVVFPVLTKVQDNKEKLLNSHKEMIQMVGFLVIPAMAGIATLASSIVLFLLGKKWEPAIPFLQLLSLSRIFTPFAILNVSVLDAIGRSDLHLRTDLIKTPVTIAVLILFIPFGLKALIISQVCASAVFFIVSAYFPGKLLGLNAGKQLLLLWKPVLSSLLMSIVIFLSTRGLDTPFLKLVVGMIMGVVSFALTAKFLQPTMFGYVIGLSSKVLNVKGRKV